MCANSQVATLHTYPGLPTVAELIPEMKACLVIVMQKCLIDRQTFVVIAMNKGSKKRLGLAHSKKDTLLKFAYPVNMINLTLDIPLLVGVDENF